jgi:hypothetical protein
VRQALAYFPHTIWLWMMASQWAMIAEEEAFVGRCGYVGDELGSALVAARQVQRLMRLCFLQAKQYAPYSKWYGTAFKRLAAARDLLPILTGVRQANDWHERERYLTRAYTFVAEQHNALGITPPVDPSTRDYFGRPFQVLFSGRLVEALLAAIPDDHLKQLKTIGSVSQFSDSTAVYDDVGLAGKLQALYR